MIYVPPPPPRIDNRIFWFPPSTSRTAIFPINKDSGTFSSDYAEPYLTSYGLSHQEINEFISEIATEVKLQKQSKDKDDQDFVCILFFNVLSIYLGSLCFSYFLQDYYYSSQRAKQEGFIAAAILTFYLMKVWMWLWPSWKAQKYSSDDMKLKCQEIVDQHNQTLRSRGLKWHLPHKFPDWIELTIDMEKPNELLELADKAFVPQATESAIIFPAQFLSRSEQFKWKRIKTFSSDFYTSEMTDDRLSPEEVQDFISEMNAGYRKTLKSFEGHLLEKMIVLPSYILVSFLLLLNFLQEVIYLSYSEEKILWTIFMGFFCIFMLERYGRQTREEKSQIIAECQGIVDRYNEDLRNRGLRWRWQLPEKFPLWISLCKGCSERIELIDVPSNSKRCAFLPQSPQHDIEAQKQNKKKKHRKNYQDQMEIRLLDN